MFFAAKYQHPHTPKVEMFNGFFSLRLAGV
jgi:hypothetical protein